MDTKETLIDELVSVKEVLQAALKWWDEEATYEVYWVDGDEYNVYDEDPPWVEMARTALDNAPKPVPKVHEPNDVLLKTATNHLTQMDVDILDGSINREVRLNPDDDAEVKALYRVWESL
jgi:hypothetical protein